MKRLAVCLLLGAIFMMFSATAPMAAEKGTAAAPENSVTVMKKTKKKRSKAVADLVDINTATAEQLKSLPGITDENAQKIIAGRPYARKNQLKQKNIITPAAYEGIKAKIVAKKAKK